jgi:ABC-2 type transport system ATP-binding protein
VDAAPALAAAEAPPAIRIDGLVKRYGDLTAVDGLDLHVAHGETLALLGPNGAGKTTTVECCEGLLAPDAGVVRVLGLDPSREGPRLRPRLGVMLQEGGVYPMARPAEVLRLFAAFHADPLDPDALLERVGLDPARRTRYRDLSGGQKQRLSLAMAVVGRPEVLFLDEPTAGLDPAARRETWEHLEELKAAGVTTVLTTHLLDEAERLADRVAIVDHGRLVALGTPAELTSTGSDTVELAVRGPRGAQRPDTEALARSLADALGVAVTGLAVGRVRVEAAPTPALVSAVARRLEQDGATLVELTTGRRRLEDVYLRLTGDDDAAPRVGGAAPARGRARRAGRASRGGAS